MVDLHTHILPDIDDGSQSWTESIKMAELAAYRGTAVLVATPHTNRESCTQRRYGNLMSESLLSLYWGLCDRIEKLDIPIRVMLGQEVYATKDIAEKIRNMDVIGLNGSDYLLTEFRFQADSEEFEWYLREIGSTGKIPLIAHPERYECVLNHPDRVLRWMQLGAMTQINAGSFLGLFGREQQNAAQYLLKHKAVTCVASDAHDTSSRIPDLFEARTALEELLGGPDTKRLLHDNPRNILKNAK